MKTEQYINMQKTFYDTRANSIDNARKLVSPGYEYLSKQSRTFLTYVLNDYMDRNVKDIKGETILEVRDCFSKLPDNLKILDFGCGVGRLMQEFAKSGFSIDGADISKNMLQFAGENSCLKSSNLYLTNGNDCGDAPENYYDIVYSMITVQHICVRSIRNSIFESISKVLKDDGVFYIQMHFYPGITSSQIPENHADWLDDKTDAKSTNSASDVWITSESLGFVYNDFSKYFQDLRFQFVKLPKMAINETYPIQWDHIIISGSKSSLLKERIYKFL
ncbi:MAG: class I SAM-dependent methyltransferase [Candidatus Gastranaerophilales bacterium]|nr:class I SAM-dependent methyltransferase [Candidatus Gastranaerophilales bacterium]